MFLIFVTNWAVRYVVGTRGMSLSRLIIGSSDEQPLKQRWRVCGLQLGHVSP